MCTYATSSRLSLHDMMMGLGALNFLKTGIQERQRETERETRGQIVVCKLQPSKTERGQQGTDTHTQCAPTQNKQRERERERKRGIDFPYRNCRK